MCYTFNSVAEAHIINVKVSTYSLSYYLNERRIIPMYSKVFKGAAVAPAAAALPQLGAGVSGTMMAVAGMIIIAGVGISTVVAKMRG